MLSFVLPKIKVGFKCRCYIPLPYNRWKWSDVVNDDKGRKEGTEEKEVLVTRFFASWLLTGYCSPFLPTGAVASHNRLTGGIGIRPKFLRKSLSWVVNILNQLIMTMGAFKLCLRAVSCKVILAWNCLFLRPVFHFTTTAAWPTAFLWKFLI